MDLVVVLCCRGRVDNPVFAGGATAVTFLGGFLGGAGGALLEMDEGARF